MAAQTNLSDLIQNSPTLKALLPLTLKRLPAQIKKLPLAQKKQIEEVLLAEQKRFPEIEEEAAAKKAVLYHDYLVFLKNFLRKTARVELKEKERKEERGEKEVEEKLLRKLKII